MTHRVRAFHTRPLRRFNSAKNSRLPGAVRSDSSLLGCSNVRRHTCRRPLKEKAIGAPDASFPTPCYAP